MGELARGDWSSSDRPSLLDLLAEEPRRDPPPRTSDPLGRMWPTPPPACVEPLLGRLAERARGGSRVVVARSLYRYLTEAPAERRDDTLRRWATRGTPACRATLARALCWPLDAPASHSALALLAADPEPAVRALALVASCHRYDEWPDAYAALLKRLAVDRHPTVRRAGRRAARAVLPDLVHTPLRLV